MVKNKFLYHGSPKKLIGNKLIPTLADDLERNPENMKEGVYATDLKDIAIAMAIISTKGVLGAGLNNFGNGKYGKIYLGKPKQKYIYLHTLPLDTFSKCKGVDNQYFSKMPVIPIKTERISVKDYMYLIKKATRKEVVDWGRRHFNKLGDVIKSRLDLK